MNFKILVILLRFALPHLAVEERHFENSSLSRTETANAVSDTFLETHRNCQDTVAWCPWKDSIWDKDALETNTCSCNSSSQSLGTDEKSNSEIESHVSNSLASSSYSKKGSDTQNAFPKALSLAQSGAGNQGSAECEGNKDTYRENAKIYDSQKGISESRCCLICKAANQCLSWNWNSNGQVCELNRSSGEQMSRNGYSSNALL